MLYSLHITGRGLHRSFSALLRKCLGRRRTMSEETPSSGRFRQTPETIERLLSTVREALEMDVAFVSEFAGDRLVFRALEGNAESFGWREGEGFPLDDSYCKRVLDGHIPNVVPDARGEDQTKDLWVTSEADIGSYVAVPVVLSNGRPYGTLCCVSHKADPRLRERDLGLMEGVARELSRQLKREGLR
jgi:GAF domain-containing protein